jgi:hypothetical protein
MIAVILDKSTFQSLSYDEQIRLNSYFIHNVTPILTMEILGDLKKETDKGKPPSENRVVDFARKLFPLHIIVNSYFEKLIQSELNGYKIPMDGRPFVDLEKNVKTLAGEKGSIIKESEEEKSITKWRDGLFHDADYELSHIWRKVTTKKDRLEALKRSLPSIDSNRIETFEKLNEEVKSILNNKNFATKILSNVIQLYKITPSIGIKLFQNWISKGTPKLSDFIPYTFHCMKIDLLFLMGLQHNLIGTRPTNKVDLEYLYYIPFGKIFFSSDKFHKQLAPCLITEDQKFIVGEELKNDLKSINEFIKTLPEEDQKPYYKEPPVNEKSLSYQLWNKYFDYPRGRPLNTSISEKKKEEIKQKMQEFLEAMNGENIELNNNESMFIVKERQISKNDPCFCGSGKPIVGCHLTTVEWSEIVDKQRKRHKK